MMLWEFEFHVGERRFFTTQYANFYAISLGLFNYMAVVSRSRLSFLSDFKCGRRNAALETSNKA